MSSVIISGVAHLCPQHFRRQSSHMSPSAPLLRRRLCFVKNPPLQYRSRSSNISNSTYFTVPDNRSTGELSIRITDPEATTPETELPMVERNLFFFLARIEDPEVPTSLATLEETSKDGRYFFF
ncbi:hypothetical protein Bca4012_013096 [Brassica carinata]